jgi:hypothetical protein
VISHVPNSILALFQSCVLNYHRRLVEWFDISLSERVPVGMMTIVYDLGPEQFDLTNPVVRRRLGRESVEYLAKFQAEVEQEFQRLNKPAEFSIDISYKLALVQQPGEADIVLTKGGTGMTAKIIEVPKDPGGTHPYRQKEVIEQVNAALGNRMHLNQFDIQCILKIYGLRKRSEFYYKGSVTGSPAQYSKAFVDWLLKEYAKDSGFFEKARAKVRATGGLHGGK